MYVFKGSRWEEGGAAEAKIEPEEISVSERRLDRIILQLKCTFFYRLFISVFNPLVDAGGIQQLESLAPELRYLPPIN